MTKIEVMTPSPITDGQIDKAVAIYRALLVKHRSELGSEMLQHVLGQSEFAAEMFAVLRKRVEAVGGMIVRRVKVDRTRSPHDALEVSGRKLHIIESVVEVMPCSKGDKVKLVYFKLDPSVYKNDLLSCDALDAEYKKRGLVPDPQAQIDDNAADLTFADTTPNACQWVDANGDYCYATFDRWYDERSVRVYRNDYGWYDYWWFAGVPQGSSASAV